MASHIGKAWGWLLSCVSLTSLAIPHSHLDCRTVSYAGQQGRVDSAKNAEADIRPLTPSIPIERELKGKDVHGYSVSLEAGQYTVVALSPASIESTLTIVGPDGRPVISLATTALSLLTETSGRYLVQVRATFADGPGGRYQIRLEPPRSPDSKDRARASAERLCWEGEQLGRQARIESIRGAIEKFKSAMVLLEKTDQRSIEMVALMWIGKCYAHIPNEEEIGLDYLQRAIQLARALGDRWNEARAELQLGNNYKDSGAPQEALEAYKSALSGFEAINNERLKAIALGNIANLAYLDLEDIPTALEYSARALSAAAAAGDHATEARVHNNLGLIRRDLGELSRALDEHAQAIQLSRSTENFELEFMALSNTGIVYRQLGEYGKALEAYQASLKLTRDLGNALREAQVLSNIGNIYRAQSDISRALEVYDQALVLFRRLKARGGEAMALNNIGTAYYQTEDYPKALEYSELSRSIRKELGDRRAESASLHQIGRTCHKLGQLTRARECLQQALEIRHQVYEINHEAETGLCLALVDRDLGRWEDARAQLERTLALIESIRARISDASLRASYIARVEETYEAYIDLLMRGRDSHPGANLDIEAWKAAERVRARVLLESIVEARAGIGEGIDPKLLERKQELQRRLNDRANRLSQLLGGKHTEDQANHAQREMEEALAEVQAAESRIRTASPRYGELTQPEPIGLTELQGMLDEQTLLLEFAIGETRSFLWAVSSSSFQSYELPPGPILEPASRRTYELLTARNLFVQGESTEVRQQRIRKADEEYWLSATDLSRMLLGPVRDLLGSKRLLIVADGALQYLPFAGLPTPEPGPGGPGHPLIDDHEIINLPSASLLSVFRRDTAAKPRAEKAVAVLADPVFQAEDVRVKAALRPSSMRSRAGKLTGTVTARTAAGGENPVPLGDRPQSPEADAATRSARESGISQFQRLRFSRLEADAIIAMASRQQGLKATDFAANKVTALDPALNRFRVLHFATHGLLNSQHPELSGIVLSLVDERGRPIDGFLRLHDIYNMKLNADLVVLSACQTALGKDVRGEGLIGLTRGFMFAGAPRVMASLWNVEDRATAQLMKKFYDEMLVKGIRPAAALRQAQRTMWREHRPPYFWAAFTLQGDWN